MLTVLTGAHFQINYHRSIITTEAGFVCAIQTLIIPATILLKPDEMKIWIDADACPVVIKDILFRAAQRTGIQLTLVANQVIKIPPSRYIRSIQVASGYDAADNEIVKRIDPGDLVITGDIPLAAEVIENKALALNPRGELYTADNISNRLMMRDFMDSLRASGVDTGGPPPLSKADRKAFADQLDKLLSQRTTD